MEATTQNAVVAESSPAPEPITDLGSFTPEQRTHWRTTGELPRSTPKEPDSATGKETSAAEEAESAPAPEAGKTSQERRKKPAADRVHELLSDKKRLEARIAELEAGPQPKPAESAPAKPAKPEAEAPKKPVRPALKDFDGTQGKTFEDYEVALAKYEDDRDEYTKSLSKFEADEAVKRERERQGREAQQQKLRTQYEEAKKRYPDYDETIEPMMGELISAQDIHVAVKQAIGTADNYVDLLYVLNQEKDSFLKLAKENPAAAIKRIAVLEYLTKEQLSKGSKANDAERGEDGKFKKNPETKVSQAPPPAAEVGGRGTPPADEVKHAVDKDDFRAYKNAANRRDIASRRS